MIDADGVVRCEKCGQELTIGMWPSCPHAQTKTVMINRDEIPGGITLENYGSEPVTFYSHSERRNYMEARGLREKETFCAFPGTDIDPAGIPNPAGYVDKQTLLNGAELLTRGKAKSWDPVAEGVIRDLVAETVPIEDGNYSGEVRDAVESSQK